MSVSSVFNRLMHIFLNVTLISLFFRSRRVHVLSGSEKAYCTKIHTRVNIAANPLIFRPSLQPLPTTKIHVKVYRAPTPQARAHENSRYVAKHEEPVSPTYRAAPIQKPVGQEGYRNIHASSSVTVKIGDSSLSSPVLSHSNSQLQKEYQQLRKELQEIYSFSNHEMFEIVEKTSHCHELLSKQLERLRTQLIASWDHPRPHLVAEEREWTAMEESLVQLEQKFQGYLAQQRLNPSQNTTKREQNNHPRGSGSKTSERQQVADALKNEYNDLSQKCQQARGELEQARQCVTDLTNHLLDILNLFNKEYVSQFMRNQKRALNFQKIQHITSPLSYPQASSLADKNQAQQNLKNDFLRQAQELSHRLQNMCCVLESAIEI